MWLLGVWIALWGDVTVANAASGVLAVGAVLALFPPPRDRPLGRPRPVAALRLLALFVWKLVEASIKLAWEVLTPHNRVNPGVVAVPIEGYDELVTTIVANMISLVPGTVTLEAQRDPDVLYVHVLHLADPDDVRTEVQHYERLAARATGRITAAQEKAS